MSTENKHVYFTCFSDIWFNLTSLIIEVMLLPVFPRLHFTPSYSNASTAFHSSQAVPRGGEMRVWGQFITAALCYSLLLILFPLDMSCSHCCNSSGYTSSSRSFPWAAAAFREYPLVLLRAAACIPSLSWCSPHNMLRCGLHMVFKEISAQMSGALPFFLSLLLLPCPQCLRDFLRLFFYHISSAFLPLTVFFSPRLFELTLASGRAVAITETFMSCYRKPLASSHRGHPSWPQNFDMYT